MASNFTETFLFDIILGREFDIWESIDYKGDWCAFCGEDRDAGKFCYNCGQRMEERNITKKRKRRIPKKEATKLIN